MKRIPNQGSLAKEDREDFVQQTKDRFYTSPVKCSSCEYKYIAEISLGVTKAAYFDHEECPYCGNLTVS